MTSALAKLLKAVQEVVDLMKTGFNYFTEKNGIMLFRKPKRFSKV